MLPPPSLSLCKPVWPRPNVGMTHPWMRTVNHMSQPLNHPLLKGWTWPASIASQRHLRTLYTTSLQDLDTEAQAQQLAHFFHEYQDVFATSSEDLGRTSIVQHCIDTGDHPPIKQHPQHIPIHKREFVHQEIQNTLQKGVIEPCGRPWSSPIVCCCKKRRRNPFLCRFQGMK